MMMNRILNALKYIKGEAILLTVTNDTVKVDAGKFKKEQIQNISTKFFREAYMLGK